MMNRTVKKLACGNHKSPDEGLCLMEAVAFVAGEPHSDHPACTDPVLGAFGRAVNDWMTDADRQRLVPIIPKLVGTAGDHKLSLRRAMLLCDAAVRQIVPIALEGVGLTAEADRLKNLAEIKDEASASAAHSAASAAYSAARSAAYSAVSAAYSAADSAADSAASAADSAAYSAVSAAHSAASAADSAARSAARKLVVDALLAAFEAAIEVQS